ncbi:zinc-ribbon domain-containing protein [Jhaorihella thermophila]|uniref:MJ0042 family finger-like domain-containing protein n=1 Tax=Jhaorihella thermophila TaxID=488547 RepID=A0A1H5T384_9RHOB|nr:zinc-ribbon domain-containing protein [Jhaorihella thermophila]SEF56497.1 MJ0042 family finger-like domain-containing protein [Jhaorihella thermophila]
MRLTCPNCDAQYEVPDEVIPPEGRDVQCSNCGHTWFQVHPDHPEAALPPEPDAEEDLAPVEEDGEPEPEHEEAAGEMPDEGWPARKRPIEPDISEILREEAEREARLRAQEAAALETQPDLGLESGADDEAERRTREAEARKARLRGEEPPAAGAAADTGSRRDLLPDIEDINSSLESPSARTTGTELGPLREHLHEPEEKVRKSGFLRGFAVAIALGVILLLVYSRAQDITRTVPQVAPALDAYVGAVDQARLWLEDQARALVAPQ